MIKKTFTLTKIKGFFSAIALKTSEQTFPNQERLHNWFQSSASKTAAGEKIPPPSSLRNDSPSDDLLHDDGHQEGEDGEADHDDEGPLVVGPRLVIFLETKESF